MKKVILFCSLLCILTLCVSCKSVYYLSIETQVPATISLPSPWANIVFANNAVAQPKGFGSKYYLYNKEIYPDIDLLLDSTLVLCTQLLAESAESDHFFSEVLLYKFPLRRDQEWMTVPILTAEELKSMEDKTEADILVTLDRLILRLEHRVMPRYVNDSDPNVYLLVEAKINCSAYNLHEQKLIHSFDLADSLRFSNLIFKDSVLIYQKVPQSIIKELLSGMSESLVNYIQPSWKRSERSLFTDKSSKMAYALSLVKKNKWKQAQEIWLQNHAREKNPQTKGRLSHNMAVSYEMLEQFDEAIEWNKQSLLELDAPKSKANIEEKDLAKNYGNVLKRRIIDNNILDQQLSK